MRVWVPSLRGTVITHITPVTVTLVTGAGGSVSNVFGTVTPPIVIEAPGVVVLGSPSLTGAVALGVTEETDAGLVLLTFGAEGLGATVIEVASSVGADVECPVLFDGGTS